MPEAENPPPNRGRPPPAPNAHEGLVGRTIAGRYRLVEMLGSGAMGEVYLGEHLTIGRQDAVKVLSRRYVDNPELRTRFLRGARNLARIRHPNVCAVYDFGETDEGAQFLAIEYVPGGTLGQLSARVGPLPVRRALRIAIQIAQGLQAAHDEGIVHRDLKPDNVMLAVDRDGKDQAKVVDFDIAKGRSEDDEGDVTRLGAIVGTPRYMSPEQLLGDSLDGRSDLYSLGLVTFWMLTGRLPFAGETAREMTARRLESQALTLEEVAPGQFSNRLDEELQRVLRRDVEGRHESAAIFAEALSALVPRDEWVDGGDDDEDGTQIMGAQASIDDATPVAHEVRREAPAFGTVVAPPGAVPQRPSSTSPRVSPQRVLIPLAVGAIITTALVIGLPGATRTPPSVDPPAPTETARDDGSEAGLDGGEPPGAAESIDTTPPATPPSTPAEEIDDPRPIRETRETPTAPTPVVTSTDPGTDLETRGGAPTVLAALREFAVELSAGELPPGRAVLLGDSARTLWAQPDLGAEIQHWSAYVIGLSELKLSRAESALAWVERALALDPGNRGYLALQTALRARRQ